jgi:hypothetical protein
MEEFSSSVRGKCNTELTQRFSAHSSGFTRSFAMDEIARVFLRFCQRSPKQARAFVVSTCGDDDDLADIMYAVVSSYKDEQKFFAAYARRFSVEIISPFLTHFSRVLLVLFVVAVLLFFLQMFFTRCEPMVAEA